MKWNGKVDKAIESNPKKPSNTQKDFRGSPETHMYITKSKMATRPLSWNCSTVKSPSIICCYTKSMEDIQFAQCWKPQNVPKLISARDIFQREFSGLVANVCKRTVKQATQVLHTPWKSAS
jgi:hypothetical protein